MALSRRGRNNIIIIVSAFMIGILTLLNHYIQQSPSNSEPLFDAAHPLTQLQLAGVWMALDDRGAWQCDERVLNCEHWVTNWQQLRVSVLATAQTAPVERPEELLLQIGQQQSQVWSLYPASGLLKSTAGNWYQIPPSLREGLQPLLNAKNQ